MEGADASDARFPLAYVIVVLMGGLRGSRANIQSETRRSAYPSLAAHWPRSSRCVVTARTVNHADDRLSSQGRRRSLHNEIIIMIIYA